MDFSGAAIATVATAASKSEGVKTSARLLERVLGPSSDVLGLALAEWTAKRIENLRRIAEKAEVKSAGRTGEVNVRVAHKILEDGSFTDDELMAEYYSGILAASKSADGRNDMGLPWTVLLAGLSSQQVLLHYLLYRQWALLLEGQSEINLLDNTRYLTTIEIDLAELIEALRWEPAMALEALLSHCVSGLQRAELIGVNYRWGPPVTESPYQSVFQADLTPAGVELYLWALGQGLASPMKFLTLGISGTEDVDVPPLRRAHLPKMPSASVTEEPHNSGELGPSEPGATD